MSPAPPTRRAGAPGGPRPSWPARLPAAAVLLATIAHAGPSRAVQDASPPGLPVLAAHPEDVTGAGIGFAELRTERAESYVGEPIEVRFRFGFEEGFLAHNLVPLFRQSLDVPVQWDVGWIGGLEGAAPRQGGPAPAVSGAPWRTFVLSGEVARAAESLETRLDGKRFRVFEFTRTFLSDRAGELVLPPTKLAFAWATRFAEHGIVDDSALDRREGFVRSAPRTVRVLALPSEGRPARFGGAVGRIAVATRLSAEQVELGRSVRLELSFRGAANLESFEAPGLEFDDGWRELGRIDRFDPGSEESGGTPVRTIDYDLAPQRAGNLRVPRAQLAVFDTSPPAAYRILESDSLAVRVLGTPATTGAGATTRETTATGARGPDAVSRKDGPGAPSAPPAPDDGGSRMPWVVAGLGLVAAAGLALVLRKRGRPGAST